MWWKSKFKTTYAYCGCLNLSWYCEVGACVVWSYVLFYVCCCNGGRSANYKEQYKKGWFDNNKKLTNCFERKINTEDFTCEVEKHPALWDSRLEDYSNKNAKLIGWESYCKFHWRLWSNTCKQTNILQQYIYLHICPCLLYTSRCV